MTGPTPLRLWPSVEPRQWLGWTIPPGYTPIRLGACRGCHVQVAWLESLKGRPCPFDRDGISHFATCPDAPRFRAGRLTADTTGPLAQVGNLALDLMAGRTPPPTEEPAE